MAVYTQIDNPAEFFSVKIYSGSGSNTTVAHGLTGGAPEMFVIKRRDSTGGWINWNTGLTNNSYYMQWNNSDQQDNSTNNLQNTATTTTNISIGDQAFTNASGGTYVLYSWRAGTSFSNDASSTSVGTIDSSGTISTKAGISILKFTGTGSAGTVAHGLASTPQMIILKNRTDGSSSFWGVYHHNSFVNASDPNVLYLNSNGAVSDDTNVFHTSTTFNSTVFSVGTYNGSNGSSDDIIAYSFTGKQGFSKFGSYTGNGNDDGSFIFLGFRPAMIIIKRTDATDHWLLYDDQRGYNGDIASLRPNENHSESTASGYEIDILSNGFKARQNHNDINGSGNSYVYMAFAKQPFVNSKGVPANAR